MLKCTQNTKAIQNQIEKAARAHYKTRKVHTFFEHGAWWLLLNDGRYFSVNDAKDIDGNFYFDFEELG